MTTSKGITNSLTAAALAAILTIGGASAAMAERNPSGSNSDGSSVSKNYDAPRSIKNTSGDRVGDGVKKSDRSEQKRKSKNRAESKTYNAEQRLALKEFRAERALIQKDFKVAVKEARIAFQALADNEESTVEEIEAAQAERKAAMKSAHEAKKAALKDLSERMSQFYKELGMKAPKL